MKHVSWLITKNDSWPNVRRPHELNWSNNAGTSNKKTETTTNTSVATTKMIGASTCSLRPIQPFVTTVVWQSLCDLCDIFTAHRLHMNKSQAYPTTCYTWRSRGVIFSVTLHSKKLRSFDLTGNVTVTCLKWLKTISMIEGFNTSNE